MAAPAGVDPRLEWALPYVGLVRWLHVAVLDGGLSLVLVLAALTSTDPDVTPWVLGGLVAVAATALTWTRAFGKFRPGVSMLVALLDIVAITLFDGVQGTHVWDAFYVVPAGWIVTIIGRRGIALAATAVGLVSILPGLVASGAPADGWGHAWLVVLLVTLVAVVVAISTDLWNGQVQLLERQQRALEEAINVKSDFIALVSHELRTPLTSIIGYLQVIEDSDEQVPAEVAADLAAVSRNADRLSRLVAELLSAAEAQTTTMELESSLVDVAELAQRGVDRASRDATRAGLRIACDLCPGLVLMADPGRLLQVIDHLLSNAIKFTPAGGQIKVSVHRWHACVDLVVADTGVGIDEASLSRVASGFFRAAHAIDSETPGVGLGLAVSTAIVEAHHGRLTVTSREHEGTSVRVRLPGTLMLAPHANILPDRPSREPASSWAPRAPRMAALPATQASRLAGGLGKA